MNWGALNPSFRAHASRPAKLLFLGLICLGWGLLILSPMQLMLHQHGSLPVWPVTDYLKALVMWLIMVLAMMVPTLAPIFKGAGTADLKSGPASAFIFGYLISWVGFCVAAVFLQWAMRTQFLLDMHMAVTAQWFSAFLLMGAGVFQLSNAKSSHLKACQLSLKRMRRSDSRHISMIQIGANYGVDCIKCCWPVMLTMFVFGLMNIIAMGALTALMVIEKASSHAQKIVKVSGLVFIGAGLTVIFI